MSKIRAHRKNTTLCEKKQNEVIWMENEIKAIFHAHTTASHDAAIKPEELIEYCINNKINACYFYIVFICNFFC